MMIGDYTDTLLYMSIYMIYIFQYTGMGACKMRPVLSSMTLLCLQFLGNQTKLHV